jgi:hypothetical protein
MATKRASKTGVAKTSKPKRKGATATKSGKTRASRATSQMKDTAMKVLAGAAAGAVRAIMPPLEKAEAAARQGGGSKERKQ